MRASDRIKLGFALTAIAGAAILLVRPFGGAPRPAPREDEAEVMRQIEAEQQRMEEKLHRGEINIGGS
jgi:hypothetical protein